MSVLLVDASQEHAVRTAEALARAGIAAEAVGGLQSCLAALDGPAGFDLLVVQQQLPDMTGLQLLLTLRQRGHSLPAIMLADPGSERLAAAAVRAGVADYLLKAPDDSHLTALPGAVRRVLRARAQTAPTHGHNPPARDYQELSHMVLVDPLTGLYNRRFLQDVMVREFAAAIRYGYPLACAMVDLDHFKQVNDRQGHLVGDEVLCSVAETLRTTFRSPDLSFRYGGEEFTVLMPHADADTGRAACERLLQRLREDGAATTVGRLRITASIGMTHLSHDNFQRPEDMLATADMALYSAKRAGRDRVHVTEAAADTPVSAAA